ncbi:MAG: leucine-rich repeat protein [Clostridia bacterium]|nr:leucine-rich repeat protein [Clostridia bacterium]
MKKAISVFLAVLMAVTMFPLSSFADMVMPLYYLRYEIENEKVTIIDSVKSLNGDFIIPDMINGYPVTAIGPEAFYVCDGITSITIPHGVTVIGDNAFGSCSKLVKVVIPESVLSIGDDAFNSCETLSIISIPESVTSIGKGAFANCKSISNICIPDSVMSIGDEAFKNCDSLTDVSISECITEIKYGMFWDCNNLDNVAIPRGVTSIGGRAFLACPNLKTIVLPESLKIVEYYAFYMCDIETIYYEGTEEDWDAIVIDESNEYALSKDKVVFNYVYPTPSNPVQPDSSDNNYEYFEYYGENISVPYCDEDDTIEYYIYDINNDKINELIVKETDFSEKIYGTYYHVYYHIYTYDNGVVKIDEIDGSECEFVLTHGDDGSGLYEHRYPGSGYYGSFKIEIENNSLVYIEDIPMEYYGQYPDMPDEIPLMNAVEKDGYLATESVKESFSKNKYKADLWLGLNDNKGITKEKILVDNIMESTGNVADNYLSAIESDKGFMMLVKWTKFGDVAFNITDGTHEQLIQKEELYESLLFDMLKMTLYGDSFQSDFASSLIDEYKNVEKVFSTALTISNTPIDFPEGLEKLKKGTIKIDDYTKGLFENKYIKDTFGSLKKFGTVFENIVEFSDTAEDFYSHMSAYIASAKMSEELKVFFNEISNNAEDPILAEAANEFVVASDSILDALVIATEEAAFDLAFQTANLFVEICVDTVVKAIPVLNVISVIYDGLGAVYDATKLISDFICSSGNNINAYYLIKATTELCNTSKIAMRNLAEKYKVDSTEINALNFIESINLYSILRIIECKSSLAFMNSLCNQGLLNKKTKLQTDVLRWIGFDVKNQKEELYIYVCESVESILLSASNNLYYLASSWLMDDYNLKSDYPEQYNYYIAKELSYPEYADSYRTVLLYASLNEDFSANFYINSIENIDGVEIREYDDTSLKTLLNRYTVKNEPKITCRDLDRSKTLPRTYTATGYFDAAENQSGVEKIYSTESNSKTIGQFEPFVYFVYSSYEEKSAKIMVFDKTSPELDVVYNLYRKDGNGNYTKVGSYDKNTGLLGYFNNLIDVGLSEDIIYSYYVQSEVTFSNGVKVLSKKSNEFSTIITKPTENDQNPVDIELLLAEEEPVMFSVRANEHSPTVSVPRGIKLSWQKTKESSGYEILRKPSYSEIYSSIGTTYKSFYIDYNISSGISYDYMVVEFSETEDKKVYQSNWKVETADCFAVSIYSDIDCINVGETLKINAYAYPETSVISWSCNDESIATIDSNGNLIAKKQGSVIVTAALQNGVFDQYKIIINDEQSKDGFIKVSVPETITIGDEIEVVISNPALGKVYDTNFNIEYDSDYLEFVSYEVCIENDFYAVNPDVDNDIIKVGIVFPASYEMPSEEIMKIRFKVISSGSTEISAVVDSWSPEPIPQSSSVIIEINDSMLNYLEYEIFDDEVVITGCDPEYNGELVIPETIEGYPVTIIDTEAFASSQITGITLPSSVYAIVEKAFEDCSQLGYVRLNEGLDYIGEDAFNMCKKLEDVSIPTTVTAIDHNAFGHCTSLTEIVIPENIAYLGEGVFWYCTNLENVIITEGLVIVSMDTFYMCRNLISITIPESVETIETQAFSCCDNLTDVYFDGSRSQWNNIIIEDSNDNLLNATIHFEKEDEAPDIIAGDANGDGKITAADARIALRISAKVDSLEKYNLTAEVLDVTGDGKLTAADARKILRIAAKIE